MADVHDNNALSFLDDDIPVITKTGDLEMVEGIVLAPAPGEKAPAQSVLPSSVGSLEVEPPADPVLASGIAELLAPSSAAPKPVAPAPAPAPAPVMAEPKPVPAPTSAAAAVPANLPVVDELPAYAKSLAFNEQVTSDDEALASVLFPEDHETAPAAAAPAPAPVPERSGPIVTPATQQPATVQADSSRADLGLEPENDSLDIKKLESQPAVQQMEAEKKKELPLLERSVEDAVIANGGTVKDEDMRRRLRTLVSLYFRELRDGLETKSKFTMPSNSGGMGFDDAAAEKTMADLATRAQAYRDALMGKAAADKSQYVAARTEKVLTHQDSIDEHNKEKGDAAFAGLMDRVGLRSEETPLPPPRPAAPPRTVPVISADGPLAPSVAIPVRAPSNAMPAPEPTRVSAAGPIPAGTPAMRSQRPIVSDVTYAPRLTGPVEEIRSMTMKDFRRLSKDPKEATLKIKDKIDLLEEQSFGTKTQGIVGWKGSEINKLYLDILRESLEGKPVVEVIAEREKNGMPFLSQSEFDAIMDLNRKLRFG